eukprot:326496-Chlamydomonas_euryale.AAC.1
MKQGSTSKLSPCTLPTRPHPTPAWLQTPAPKAPGPPARLQTRQPIRSTAGGASRARAAAESSGRRSSRCRPTTPA